LIVPDRLRVILLAEVGAAEVEVSALVVRIRPDELLELLNLPHGVSVRAGLRRLDQETLSVGGLLGECDGLVEMLEELFAGRGAVGERKLGPREGRVECGGLLEVGDGIRDFQLLDQVAARDELGARLGGGRGDRDLPVARGSGRRRLRLGGRGFGRGFLLCASGRRPGEDRENQQKRAA
jgi:hypothetical protein